MFITSLKEDNWQLIDSVLTNTTEVNTLTYFALCKWLYMGICSESSKFEVRSEFD